MLLEPWSIMVNLNDNPNFSNACEVDFIVMNVRKGLFKTSETTAKSSNFPPYVIFSFFYAGNNLTLFRNLWFLSVFPFLEECALKTAGFLEQFPETRHESLSMVTN